MIPLVYGAPIIKSDRAGASWETLAKQSMHVDWVAVDWSDPAKRLLLTLKHEMAGLLLASSMSWLAYDPHGDDLYVMKMGSDLYRMRRGK